MPIYTYTLSVSQYGILETALVSIQLLLVFYNAGISQALVRYWSDAPDDAGAARVAGTAIVTAVTIATAGALLTLAVGFPITHHLIGATFTAWAFVGLVAAGFTRSLHQQFSAVYRASRRSGAFIAMQIAAGVLWIASCYIFMRRLHLGVAGALWSQTVGFGLVAAAGLAAVWRRIPLSFDRTFVRRLVRFGAPLIASTSAWFILNASDRYFLGVFRTFREVGEYSLGYRVASLLALGIVTPIQLALAPIVFQAAGEPDLARKLGRVAEGMAWAIGLAGGGLALATPLVIRLIAPPEYTGAALFTFWIIPSGIGLGAYYWSAALLQLRHRTLHIATTVVAAAVMNLALNWALIPRIGAIGAAIATDVAILSAAAAVMVLGVRAQRIVTRRSSLLLAAVVFCAMFVVGILQREASVTPVPRITGDTVLVIAAIGLGVWSLRRPRPVALEDPATR